MANSNEYMRKYMKQRYHDRREKYITLLGGKCVDCGTVEDLQFDHKNPYDKSFDLGKHLTHSEAKLLPELQKCELRCGACHREKFKTDGSTEKNRAKGERVNHAKLTESLVREIFAIQDTHLSIAKTYGVSRSTVSQIKRKEIWKHLSL